jgi:hypothetical protein
MESSICPGKKRKRKRMSIGKLKVAKQGKIWNE